MKRSCALLILCMMMCAACTRAPWFLINTSGIATYNRHTGQFEILWENHATQVKTIHDTIYTDSVSIKP